MAAKNDPVVIVPKEEPFHENGKPLNLDFKVVFAPTNVRGLGEKKEDIPRDGKYHKMSLLTGEEGSNKNNKLDKLLYFNCGELMFDCETRHMSENSIDDMMVRLQESILFFRHQLDESISSSKNTSGSEELFSRIPGKVTIDLAAYHPFPEMAIAWCEIFGATWFEGVEEYAFIRNYANINLAQLIEPYTDKGWTFEVEYVAFLDIVAIRRETVEEQYERLRREEEIKIKQYEEYERKIKEIENAKKEYQRLNDYSNVISAGAMVWGVASFIVGCVCPPVGIGMAIVGGAAIVGSSAYVHKQQADIEEKYLGEIETFSHVTGVMLDLVFVIPWGSIAGAMVGGAYEVSIGIGVDFLVTNAGLFRTGYDNATFENIKPALPEKNITEPNKNEVSPTIISTTGNCSI